MAADELKITRPMRSPSNLVTNVLKVLTSCASKVAMEPEMSRQSMMSRLRLCGLSMVVSSGRAAPTMAAPPSRQALTASTTSRIRCVRRACWYAGNRVRAWELATGAPDRRALRVIPR